MYKMQQITSDPYQKQSFVLPDGTTFTMILYFVPMQQGWFITELTYGDFIIQGFRVSNSPNMLNQWRNKLPFGMACLSTKQREPSLQDDFSSEASVLYVLDQAEVEEYAEYLRG